MAWVKHFSIPNCKKNKTKKCISFLFQWCPSHFVKSLLCKHLYDVFSLLWPDTAEKSVTRLLWIYEAHFMWQVYCFYHIDFHCCTCSLFANHLSKLQFVLVNYIFERCFWFLSGSVEFIHFKCLKWRFKGCDSL